MNEFTTGPMVLEEFMKIVSLMENPEGSEAVRKALRFYQIPDKLEYKWGNNSELMKILHHYDNPQNEWELAQMLKLVEGKDSLLEIGSNFGGTLKRMASVMNKGARIVSVDLAADDTPSFLNPQASLRDTCRKIALVGGNVELFLGNSHNEEVKKKVSNFAPYDFVFIDGDHSYEGVKKDWEDYGPMGRIVGFHDIGGGVTDVVKFWTELKCTTKYRTEEFISDHEKKFGIGIVYRE